VLREGKMDEDTTCILVTRIFYKSCFTENRAKRA
jgi:hypothetical protein